ncbi:MAG: ABC transporter substrate-binding protein, partial [Deltaproteobacteria bacterium]|nr:ABC transporter substrate-binding protein [Deltaproteobacteria bacterium]
MRLFAALLIIVTLFVSTLFPAMAAENETSFKQLTEKARGSEVKWFMWGGSPAINSWVDTYISSEVKKRYDITLKRVPADAAIFINKLLSEKQTRKEKGTMDLLWINGENFKNAMENDLLYGPINNKLPNFSYIDPVSVEFDFGYPVRGYEAPYGRAQFVFEYDSAVVMQPPETFEELKEWLANNPGMFTYPKPPDFTGSAFIRQLFYAISGGHEQYLLGLDTELYARNAEKLWRYLNDIKPY